MGHGLLQGQTQQQYYDIGSYGGYQFISLTDVIDNFMATYTGEDKILENTSRSDVSFHAHRALAELHYDTFRSCKSQEITVPASLTMILPQDYVNYTKISWSDSSGIKHRLYPTLCNTSNPTNPYQNSDGDFSLSITATSTTGSTWLVLDDIYTNISIGDIVSGPLMSNHPSTPPTGWLVNSIFTSGGVTIITARAVFPLGTFWVNTLATTTETITITNPNGNLILDTESGVVVGDGTAGAFNPASAWTAGDYTITAGAGVDISGVEVGMYVNYNQFQIQVGTRVVDINGQVITVDNPHLANAPILIGSIYFSSAESFSDTWKNYSSTTPSENQDDYQDDTYWPAGGERYGLDPQHAQANGSFYIDCNAGKIHFSSNISGKTVILDYISDGLGTDAEMVVPKLAEEAIYKWITYGCLSARMNIPEYVVRRFKKEKFAETRKAKLRLSNIKLEEISQVLRGKSKHIKH